VLGPLASALVLVVVACHTAGPAGLPTPGDRIDLAARICAKITSCAHAHDAPRDRDPAACVDASMARPFRQADPFDACVLAAQGCAGVDACARDRADAPTTAYCRSHAGTRTGCDGSHFVTCSPDDPAESSAVDCGAFGATCGDLPQAGGLMARGCIYPGLCPSGGPEMHCDGALAVVTCRDGATERTACAGAARCEEHKGSDGAVSAVCESPGHRDEHAELGAARVAPGPRACEHAAPKCEGDTLTFCAAGRRFHLSCPELRLGACDPDAHGVDAACAPAARGPSPPSSP
jgi:hypothetical protein